ncbi:uncharacterized protein LOC110456398 [Mizuhopecten yessoensis]|uniref:uncharacterized protein LOC110456398 n=1 Tax=Mizuhopecten yessoensis TaxID=6573 RepID=UPI000B4595BA|nr:uncharacterized protein LOC110456398 [Mizuhopecten yessoensis]
MLNYYFWIVFHILNYDCVFASASVSSSFMELKSDIGGRVFDSPKFDIKTRGSIECGMKCLQYACCFTITFNPTTRQCVGYRSTFDNTDAYFPDAESITYELQHRGLWGADSYVYNSSIDLCFSLKTTPASQIEAIEYCEMDGGYLMPIETSEKILEVWAEVITSIPGSSLVADPLFWVDGFNDGTGQFMLRNGNSISNSLLWAPGEPSHTGQHCVALSEQFLFDDNCPESHKYICEYI